MSGGSAAIPRAADARGDTIGALTFYSAGARYQTAFYGQLSAEKAGVQQMSLGHDPVPTAADVSRFEGRDVIRAACCLRTGTE